MIYDGEKERRGVDETFDYVIVGSGAAGATAARVLADSGISLSWEIRCVGEAGGKR